MTLPISFYLFPPSSGFSYNCVCRCREDSAESSPGSSSKSKKSKNKMETTNGKFHQTWGEFRLQAAAPPHHEQHTDHSTLSMTSSEGATRRPTASSDSGYTPSKIVSLENAEKSYGKSEVKVLDRLDMTVEKGIM